MAYLTIKPTRFDLAVADRVAADTSQIPEAVAGALTWGADEHVLGGLALAWWLCSRFGDAPQRRSGNHLLLCSVVVAALPHVFKKFIDQTRPDRRTLVGHFRGVPFSGKRKDAFPSGHALHIGALVSATSGLAPRYRNMVWGIGAALVLTRVVLLAHWVTDVAAGLVLGAASERLLRRVTGFKPNDLGPIDLAPDAGHARPSR